MCSFICAVNPGNWSFQSNFFDLLDDYLLGAIQQLRGQEEVEGGFVTLYDLDENCDY